MKNNYHVSYQFLRLRPTEEMADNTLCFAAETTDDRGEKLGTVTLSGLPEGRAEIARRMENATEAQRELAATLALQLAFESLDFSEAAVDGTVINKRAFRASHDFLHRISLEKRACEPSDALGNVRLLEFPQQGDERGHLVIAEGERDVPFAIQRIFYIYGSDADVVRGKHANRRTEFVLINVSGSSKVIARDGRGNERTFCLCRPHIGIYLPRMVWKDMMEFSPDSVLLALASEHYDASEYIRDYGVFQREMNV